MPTKHNPRRIAGEDRPPRQLDTITERSDLLLSLCYLLMFFSLAQPGILFPGLNPFRPFFTLASFALLLHVYRKMSTGYKDVKLPVNKYIYLIVIAYTLSEFQYLWLSGTMATFMFWLKKALLFYLIVNSVEDTDQLKHLLWAVVFAGITLTWFGWDMYWNNPESLFNAGRLQSVGNYNLSNSFALFLTLTFPLVFALFEAEKKTVLRCFILLFMGVMVISSIYTKSRGGSFGMLIGVILCFLLSRKAIKNKGMKIVMIAVLIAMFTGAGLAIIMSRSDVAGYFGGGGEASSGDRLLAWQAAVKMFFDHPVFGVGWTRFVDYVREYGHDRRLLAHNTALSVLAETGIFGFWCFMAIIIISMKQLIKMRQKWLHEEHNQIRVCLANGVLVSFICFLINSSVSVKDHDPMYWVILTLCGVLSKLYQKEMVFNPGELKSK